MQAKQQHHHKKRFGYKVIRRFHHHKSSALSGSDMHLRTPTLAWHEEGQEKFMGMLILPARGNRERVERVRTQCATLAEAEVSQLKSNPNARQEMQEVRAYLLCAGLNSRIY